ncbi:GNAT family N-acetyltransferase [Agaribacterium sp. ZY112]|uniref:GNAT family N-acetyltransferase n=1 Tax=Agaribacterium sp. ZY112 TaxID=3233574 RepID=UPI003525B487
MQEAYEPYKARLQGAFLPPLTADYQSEIRNYPAWVLEQQLEQPPKKQEGKQTDLLGALFMDFHKQAFIANIALRPSSQGLGMGSALIKFAEQETRKRGFNELYLATHHLLNENLSLYQYLGWQEIERNKQKVVMKKVLPLSN